MIEKILEKRETRLEQEFLKLGCIDVEIMVDMHNTDVSDYTGDELVRFFVEIDDENDDHIYNIFVKEKLFKSYESETENILYKEMAKAILECANNNILSKKETLFLVINYKLIDLDCYSVSKSIINTEKALKIYNNVYKEYNKDYKLDFELKDMNFFKKEFKELIFKVGDIKLISIFNLIYKLLV